MSSRAYLQCVKKKEKKKKKKHPFPHTEMMIGYEHDISNNKKPGKPCTCIMASKLPETPPILVFFFPIRSHPTPIQFRFGPQSVQTPESS